MMVICLSHKYGMNLENNFMDIELNSMEILFILGAGVLTIAFYFIIRKVYLELKNQDPS